MQLFQTVRRFEIPVQPQLVLLYKTLLNIEGLGRQLYPNLNLWDTAKPFLEQWMKKQLSPAAIQKKSTLHSIGLVAATFGFCLSILGNGQLITAPFLISLAPWVGVFGLILIYIKSK